MLVFVSFLSFPHGQYIKWHWQLLTKLCAQNTTRIALNIESKKHTHIRGVEETKRSMHIKTEKNGRERARHIVAASRKRGSKREHEKTPLSHAQTK